MKKQTSKKAKEMMLMRKVLMTTVAVSVIGSSMGSTLNVFAAQNQVKNAVETVNKKKEARAATLGQNDSQLLKNTEFNVNAAETGVTDWALKLKSSAAYGANLEREKPDGSTGFYRFVPIGNNALRNWIFLKKVTVNSKSALQIWSRGGSTSGYAVDGRAEQEVATIPGRTYVSSVDVVKDAGSSSSRNANAYVGAGANSTGWTTIPAGAGRTLSKEFVAENAKEIFSLGQYTSGGDDSQHTAINFSNINFAEKYHTEWNLVDNLFTDLTHTTIKPTVTTTEVEAAKAEVDKMATSVDKTAMLDLLKTAEELANVAKPTVNPINNTQTELTGKARPHAKVKLETRTRLPYEVDADANGDYKFIIPKQPAGSKVAVKQTVGDRTSEIAEVIVSDAIPYAQPTVNPVSSTDTHVTGKATDAINATVEIMIGSDKYTGTVDASGNFNVDIHTARPKDTEMILTLKGPNSKTSAPLTVKVGQSTLEKARDAVEALFTDGTQTAIKDSTNQTAIDDAQKLVDKLPAGSDKTELQEEIKNAQDLLDKRNAEEQAKAARESVDNLFSDATHEQLAHGITQADIDAAKAKVEALPNGSEKTELLEEVQKAQALFDKIPGVGTLTPKDFHLGDKYVSGTYTGAVTKLSLKVNGTVYPNGTLNNDGTFSFYTVGKITKLTDDVKVIGYDKKGNIVSEEKVNVKDATILPGTITPATFKLGTDKNITGSYTGDVSKVDVTVDGVKYNGGEVKNGQFTFYAVDKIKQADAVVIVTAYNKNGEKLDQKTVKVEDERPTVGTVSPADFKLGTDKFITGAYTGAVSKVKVTVNGTDYQGGSVTNGQINFYAFDKIKNASDVVVVTAYDAKGKELDQKTVNVTTAAPIAADVTATDYTLATDKNITGTYKGDVATFEVTVNGTSYRGGTKNPTSGTYSFYAYDKIKAKTDVVTVKALDKNGNTLKQTTLVIK
ncbi:immunoglobulin-like domain-containing protein [Brochothrix thermosphacta]|uniref:immunoglobulin-like domain-containing protein n=1 Tax=Brochothrix thermosphacta TaxID=2756 RepID=UPI0027139846|nr:immunoglobulin-like domain-containing protein [Brochothrix thermosphacta]MDO7863194.1 toxin Cry1Ac domain D-VI-related protein [Brochothrix thermosphacta]